MTPCRDTRWPFDTLIEVTSGERFHTAVAAARAVCGRCPIQQACLVENRREDWARAVIMGLSKQQRVSATRGQVEHGTPAGHRHHLRNGTRPCGPCLRAEAQRSAGRRAAA